MSLINENELCDKRQVVVFCKIFCVLLGNSWQEILYEAVDNARVVVAFITKSYIQSTVCREEFNIALARYMSMVCCA
jgi:hypothetical protein